jgi:hypothetical protein
MKTLIAALFLMLPLAAADVSGDWKLEGDIAGNPVNPVCTLKQDGANLEGVCKHPDQEAPIAIKGQVDGDKVKWGYEIEHNGTKYQLLYTATLESETAMKGTVDAGVAAGDFKATKQPKEK